MKVYITKYALTSGIFETKAELSGSSDTMIIEETASGYRNFYHKPFWYEKKEEAIKHAEELKLKKIISLKKSITKLEKMVFN